MKPLPLPVRVAAGLAISAVDRARNLPGKLAELPVTVVSQALQLSMRVQQQVTELAIKGDDALSTLRPVEETPEWATFDEDTDRYDATTPVAGARSRFEAVDDEVIDAEDDEDDELDLEDLGDVAAGHADPGELAADAERAAAEVNIATAGRREAPLGDLAAEEDTGAGELADDAEQAAIELDIVPAEQVEARAGAANADGPAALPNYTELSVPQLRARMRKLSLNELQELVEFERGHDNRPEYVGMLTRRISTVRSQR